MFLSDIEALGVLGAGLSLSGFDFPVVKFSIPGAAGGGTADRGQLICRISTLEFRCRL